MAVNKYKDDKTEELEFLARKLQEKDIPVSLLEGHNLGGKGAIDIAFKLASLVEKENNFKFIYDLSDSIITKITKVAQEIYGAKNVIFSDNAKENIKKIEALNLDKVPVCIAKTPYSMSDDPKNLLCDEEFDITINDIELKNGAEFIVALAGNIMTMPGLPRIPNAEKIDLDEDNNIVGIF